MNKNLNIYIIIHYFPISRVPSNQDVNNFSLIIWLFVVIGLNHALDCSDMIIEAFKD